MKKILALLLSVCMVLCLTACVYIPNLYNREFDAEDIYTLVAPSVVEINAESSKVSSTGTGFFYDEKGTIITNYHVIEDCTSATITLASGQTYSVTEVLGYSKNRDIAILSTGCSNSVPLKIRTTGVKTGETVYAIGSSLGLSGSLSDGLVSAAERNIDGDIYIQTTAPISQGNSGGPLVDKDGYVIGITSATFSEGQNLNLAIPIAEVDNISLTSNISLERLFPPEKQEVEWLSDYRFQYYEDESTYVLLFQLSDKEEVPMSANGTVKIRIVNNDNVTVYNKVHNFSSTNFEEWIYDDSDEMYVATIYISPQNISKGSTEYGTVYFEVYGAAYSFDECTISAFDLPTSSNSGSNNTQQGESTTPPQTQPTQYTCLEDTCKNVVSKSGEYCADHRCSTVGCSNKKDTKDLYCYWCTCSELYCKNAKQSNGRYCIQHTCNSKNCNSNKENNSNYCYYHECSETLCHNERSETGSYCIEHTCKSDGCPSAKKTTDNFCWSHKCITTGCKGERIGGLISYCIEHACASKGCLSPKSSTSDFCNLHDCYIGTCHNETKGYGLYCVEHSCSYGDCTSQRERGSKYCYSHQ